MRVLTLTHNYPRYKGDHSGSFIEELINALPRDKVKSIVLCPHAPGLPDREERKEILIYRFRYSNEEQETLAYKGKMLSSLANPYRGLRLLSSFNASFIKAARKIIIREEIDVLHAHWLIPGGLAARVALSGIKLPFFLSLHGTDVRLLRKLPAGGLLAGWVLSKVNLILPVSGYLGERLERLTGRRINSYTLPMPASGMFLSSARRYLKRRLVAVGNLKKQKRFDVLIRALGILKGKKLNLELIIVGDGPERGKLETLASSLGLAERIVFRGRIPHHHLPGVLFDAGVMVLPSVGEGFGIALAEAQLAGLVAVGADAGGQREIISDGKTGVLVEPEDPDALAGAIRRLYNNEEKSLKIARAGQLQARHRFLALPAAERLTHIYSSTVH